ncbi:MAG TPA: hypothetical protein VFJ85_15560 [Acidimicrobiales bacterium]|nr:hypothetical protein [Acidimicrobiales bacterium]
MAEMSRLRSWLRAQPFVAMGDQVDEPLPAGGRGWKAVAVLVAVVATFLMVANRGTHPGGLSAEGPRVTGTTSPALHDADPPAVDDPAPTVASTTPSPPTTKKAATPTTEANSVSQQALARAHQPGEQKALRLGLIVPTKGSMAAEGAQIADVVRQRVAAANAAGGVAGVPVELDMAPAEDPAAIAAMVQRATVLVGGFGASAPTGIPWLLPADPSIAGPDVVPAESPARSAGVQLGGLLRRQGINGVTGVIVGSGPDAALADGLATKVPTTTVAAQEAGTCAPEVAALQRAGAVALAIAGGPDLAAKCMKAAFAKIWHPTYGILLAPSAAYAGLQSMPEALGARTVLGLPWPTSTAPGAARFRATTSSTSYRALVSYAATELAIDVARQQGGISLESIEQGIWRNDLIDLSGLTSRVNILVVAFLGTWLIAG